MKRLIVFLLALVVGAHALSAVLLVNGFNYFDDLYGYLLDDPRFDTVYRISIQDTLPPLSVLQLYDCALNDGFHSICGPVAFGDLLADYVDGGGKVLSIYYSLKGPFANAPTGRWWDDQYSPYGCTSCEHLHGYQDLIIDNPGHTIFDGVDGVGNVYGRVQTELRPGAVELAHFTDAGGVALNADESVCGINYSSSDDHFWTGDGFRLIANAACHLADYVDIQPTSWGQIKALGE